MVDKYGFDRDDARRLRGREPPQGRRGDRERRVRAPRSSRSRVEGGVARARRGHPRRRQPRRPRQPQDDRARGPHHRRQCQPDLRRRLGRAGGVGGGAQAARPDAAGADRQSDRHRRRSGDHARRADQRHAPRARRGRGGTSTRSTCTRSTRRSRRCRWPGSSRSGRQSGAAQRQRRRDRARPSAWARAGPS